MASKLLTGTACRRSAALFDWGNLVAVSLAGIPLFTIDATVGIGTILAAILGIVPLILWFGGSMLLYAFVRHHPQPRVGHHAQWAAYRYYGLMGSLIVVATFFPPDLDYYRLYWGLAAVILLPWTVLALVRIHREPWPDVLYEADPTDPNPN